MCGPWKGLNYDRQSPCGWEGSRLDCPGLTGGRNEDVGAGRSWVPTGPSSSSLTTFVPLPTGWTNAASWQGCVWEGHRAGCVWEGHSKCSKMGGPKDHCRAQCPVMFFLASNPLNRLSGFSAKGT